MGMPGKTELARYVQLWKAYECRAIGLEDLKQSMAREFFPDDPAAQARIMELNEDLIRLCGEIMERDEGGSFEERHAGLLATLGPRITELFHEDDVSNLLDPSVVILADQEPPRIVVVERLTLVEVLAEARAIAATSLIAAEKPILVLIFDEAGSARFIEDPRTNPYWWANLHDG